MQREGEIEPEDREVMLGAALAHTFHVFSLLNQY